MTSPFPTILAALVARCEVLLPDWAVTCGAGPTDDFGSYCMVGMRDPRSTSAGGAQVRWSVPASAAVDSDESATIPVVLFCWNGDGDSLTAVTEAFAAASLIHDDMLTSPSLGVTSSAWEVVAGPHGEEGGDMTAEWDAVTDEQGASAMVVLQIPYMAFRRY